MVYVKQPCLPKLAQMTLLEKEDPFLDSRPGCPTRVRGTYFASLTPSLELQRGFFRARFGKNVLSMPLRCPKSFGRPFKASAIASPVNQARQDPARPRQITCFACAKGVESKLQSEGHTFMSGIGMT